MSKEFTEIEVVVWNGVLDNIEDKGGPCVPIRVTYKDYDKEHDLDEDNVFEDESGIYSQRTWEFGK